VIFVVAFLILRTKRFKLELQNTTNYNKRDPLKIELTSLTTLKHISPALVIGCFEDSRDKLFTDCNAALDGCLDRLSVSREFRGMLNTTSLIHTLGKLPAERLLLVGLGKKADLNDERLRWAASNSVQVLRSARVASFTTALHLVGKTENAIEAVCEGALLGSYRFENYKTKDGGERFYFGEMTLIIPKGINKSEAKAKVERTNILCRGVQLARDLVSHPGNVATTGYLAETAREIAMRHNLTCNVLEMDELEQLGMNALLAVGKGSTEPPRLIVMEYRGASTMDRPVVLVGKGITFDSGGISIKPSNRMEELKTDMAGGAAVLGVLDVTAKLKLRVNLVCIIPTAENMPDGKAYKPGDVVTSMSGTTIEITNTDAEGRLVLCDALYYAQKYKPAVMIDLATLTGACVVALGHEASGLMGNNPRLVNALKKAGESCGERVWELPLWDCYGEAIKSDIADLKNAGSRDGGSITAGWFLKQFVGKTHWAHLDIAGTAWSDKSRPCTPKGATGIGVRLLIKYLLGIVNMQTVKK
jgi:leucyl aminopeptidase